MKNFRLLTALLVIAFVPGFVTGQNVIHITAGDDQIDGALFQAQAGDIIELTTDGGVYHEQFTAVIDVPVTIRAAAGLTSKPVWTCDDNSRMITIQNDLVLDGIIFDAALGDSLTEYGIRTGDSIDVKWGYDLRINNCEFMNFSSDDDGHAVYGDGDTQADSVIITNSRFVNIDGEMVRFKDAAVAPSSVLYFMVENCTFWREGEGDEAIYVEDHDNNLETPGPEFIVNHVTVYNPGGKAIYPKEFEGAIIKNCIVSDNYGEGYACRLYGPGSELGRLLYFNCASGVQASGGFDYPDDVVLKEQNPYFENPENGNFAVAAGSPAAMFADDGFALGDTNNGTWDASEKTLWEIVENMQWGDLIEDAVTEGDTVMFVTDGGYYFNPGRADFRSGCVLMAKPGLENRPIIKAPYGESALIKIYDGSYVLKGLHLQGNTMQQNIPDSSGDATPYLYYFEDVVGENPATYNIILVEDCEFSKCRLRAIHMDDSNLIDSLIVKDCLFWEIGETGIYGREAARNLNYAQITNNTFYKFGQYAIRLQDVGEMEISHNTFFFSDSTLTGRKGNTGVLATDDTVITIKDNIFYDMLYGVRVYGPSPTVEYNLYWECDTTIKSVDHPELTFPIFNEVGDPNFADTTLANLNLAVDENGPAYTNASDGENLGDTKWGSYNPLSVDKKDRLPNFYALHQNYPNPFNPSTRIEFHLAAAGHVTLKIFDILGRELTTLVDREMIPGNHAITWNAKSYAAGIYFYKINVNDYEKIMKMMLIK